MCEMPKKRHPMTTRQAANILASEVSKGYFDENDLNLAEEKGPFDFQTSEQNPESEYNDHMDIKMPDFGDSEAD
jgi:hypothetical protein